MTKSGTRFTKTLEKIVTTGLSPRQLAVLDAIYELPARPVDLCHRFRISAGALTQITDQLEKRKYAFRAAVEDDRRSQLVCPTEEGRRLIDDLR